MTASKTDCQESLCKIIQSMFLQTLLLGQTHLWNDNWQPITRKTTSTWFSAAPIISPAVRQAKLSVLWSFLEGCLNISSASPKPCKHKILQSSPKTVAEGFRISEESLGLLLALPTFRPKYFFPSELLIFLYWQPWKNLFLIKEGQFYPQELYP